jgi:oxygen-independent coproporphyrinogen-3 oxidase
MAGIYIHIPFCKQACHYCDFHFSTNLQLKLPMLKAIQQELSLQQNYLGGEKVETIYLGGGTPSLLAAQEIAAILTCIQRLFSCEEVMEVTLEANPDDIQIDKLLAWRAIGINRLSIGIQTFDEVLLRYLNRAHDAAQAIASLEMAAQAGFTNLNLDLIYAIAGQSEQMLTRDLTLATQFHPTHISAYCLTIEPNTAFGRWLEKGKLQTVDEEVAAQHFHWVADTLAAQGYEQYEISNFSLPGYQAQHNTSYWKQGHYLGIGPGAHSYNGMSRQHNIAHNQQYIKHIQVGTIPSTVEVLQLQDHVNEYVMTSLRTKWGCDMRYLQEKYNYDLKGQHFTYVEQLVSTQLAYIQQDILFLTQQGKLLADKIAADLFVV